MPAPFDVVWKASAAKELQALDSVVQQRILAATRTLATRPRPSGCRKLQGTDHTYRIRIGDYRVVYGVDSSVKLVMVLRVRHRREVYR